jgi:hypothetical protein
MGSGVLSLCLISLLILVCNADGGSWSSLPRHSWVGTATNVGAICVLIFVPLTGIKVGEIWAKRRNSLDDTNRK